MWVCLCHGIRCRDVKEAAGDGASRAGDVFRKFEVRVRCGKCVPTICNLLNESQVANEHGDDDTAHHPMACCGGQG